LGGITSAARSFKVPMISKQCTSAECSWESPIAPNKKQQKAARYTEAYGPVELPQKLPPWRLTVPEYSAHFAREYGGDWTFGRHK
jgi:hypothetical protein